VSSDNDAKPGSEIEVSLAAIRDIAQRWLVYIKKRQHRVKIAKAFLAGFVVLFILASIGVAAVLTQYPRSFFIENRDFTIAMLGAVVLSGIVTGVVSFIWLGKKQDPSLAKLSELVDGMNNIRSQHTVDTAIAVTERFLQELPSLVRKRSRDSFLFGMVAFVLVSILALPPAGIIVGISVWLYFRYETNRTYEREISQLEEQKIAFERRKREFIETL
jgi:hypothetical protein